MDIDLKHPLIKKANSVSSDEIQEAAGIPPILRLKDQTFSCKICHAQELPNELREQLWLLFEENMRTFYAQAPSFSWDPEEKKEEMFHALSRVVLLQPIQLDEGLQSPGASESPVVAFSMFRFEREDKRNMLYCYELQVRISARRSGLGKALLDVLGKIGKAYSMPRILLTAFTVCVPILRSFRVCYRCNFAFA